MINDNVIEFSDDGKLSSVLFYSHRNEINIFVEDAGKEYKYYAIFKKLLNDTCKIGKIFAMKGKKGVKKAYEMYHELYEEKPALYIVDADFDILLQKDIIISENFVYLDRYNIESYCFEKDALLDFLSYRNKIRGDEISKMIDLDDWEYNTFVKLECLFINYLIVQMSSIDMKNVGLDACDFLNNDSAIIDDNKIGDYITNVKSRIPNYEELNSLAIDKYNKHLNGNPKCLICGKYVLDVLCRYLYKMNMNFKKNDLNDWLFDRIDLNNLIFLKDRIHTILEN